MTKEQAAEHAYPTTGSSNFRDYTLDEMHTAFIKGWDSKPSDAVDFARWLLKNNYEIKLGCFIKWVRPNLSYHTYSEEEIYEQFKNNPK